MEIGRAAYSAVTDLSFDDAVARCHELLIERGFGVLTEIDIQATLKKKLDVDRDPYLILGACHPPSANRALSATPEVGVMLPCNVAVSIEDGRTWVRAMNPESAMGFFENAELAAVADEVGAALRQVVEAVESESWGQVKRGHDTN